MIFPFLRGLASPFKSPVIYILLLFNIAVFGISTAIGESAQSSIEAILDNDEFMKTQGILFAQKIKAQPKIFSAVLKKLSDDALTGDDESLIAMGNLALRNNEFMSTANAILPKGDLVAFKFWKQKFNQLLSLQDRHPSYLMGITNSQHTVESFFLYQFAHSDAAHLFWNMLFLLVFGIFVEAVIGSVRTLLIYLCSGVIGALTFAMISGYSSSPLIGASGAITGLIGVVVTLSWGYRLPFFYWLLPIKNYFGFVALPAWILVIVYVLPDVSGYLASVSDFHSVAYSAHLGGAIAGALIGFVLRPKFRPHLEQTLDEVYSRLPHEVLRNSASSQGPRSYFQRPTY
jgi:membrane associated rhomboid family serine protease